MVLCNFPEHPTDPDIETAVKGPGTSSTRIMLDEAQLETWLQPAKELLDRSISAW
jgi:hypothetical protein